MAEQTTMTGNQGSFIGKLAETMSHSSVERVYGTPVERGGVTVIPVARARFGFGGGSNRKHANAPDAEEGLGGGGGAKAQPAGYIVIQNGKAEYREIRDRASTMLRLGSALLALGVSSWLVLRGLAALERSQARTASSAWRFAHAPEFEHHPMRGRFEGMHPREKLRPLMSRAQSRLEQLRR